MDLERAGSLQMHVEWCEVDLERARSLKVHFLMVRSVLLASGLAPQACRAARKVDLERAGSLGMHVALRDVALERARSL